MALSFEILCSILPQAVRSPEGQWLKSPYVRYMLYYENIKQPDAMRRLLTVRFDTRLTLRLDRKPPQKKRPIDLLREGMLLFRAASSPAPEGTIDIPVGTLLERFEQERKRERTATGTDFIICKQSDSLGRPGIFLHGTDTDGDGNEYSYFQVSLQCTTAGIPKTLSADSPFDRILTHLAGAAMPQTLSIVAPLRQAG